MGLLSDAPLQWFVPGHLLILLVWMDCLQPRPNLHRQHVPLPKMCSNAQTHMRIGPAQHSTAQCHLPLIQKEKKKVNTIPKTEPHRERRLTKRIYFFKKMAVKESVSVFGDSKFPIWIISTPSQYCLMIFFNTDILFPPCLVF